MMIFNIVFIVTFIITRLLTYSLHDKKDYNSNTITEYIRKKSNFEFHHIHIGILLLVVLTIFTQFLQINEIIYYLLLAISLSLIVDQLFPLLKICCYFSKYSLIAAVVLHISVLIIFNGTHYF